MEDGSLYLLEEAARLTGRTTEALRKRFLRGQIEGVSSKEANDGKVRLRLTPGQLADLRIPDNEPDEPSVETSGNHPDGALMRLVESLEGRAVRAEAAADREREAAEAARAAHDADRRRWDDERQDWRASLDTMAAELTANRNGRASDRRIAVAAVRRIREQSTALKVQLDQVLAGQQHAASVGAPPHPPQGLIARLFSRKVRP